MRPKMSIDEFRANLKRRHGRNFVKDMDGIFDGSSTVRGISEDYSLSITRVAQIFKRMYGKKLKDVIRDGFAEDSSGTIFNYQNIEKKKLIVMLPKTLHDRLKDHSQKSNLSMAEIVRGCLVDMYAPDGMGKLHKLFFQ